jgi:hypothetical protein
MGGVLARVSLHVRFWRVHDASASKTSSNIDARDRFYRVFTAICILFMRITSSRTKEGQSEACWPDRSRGGIGDSVKPKQEN